MKKNKKDMENIHYYVFIVGAIEMNKLIYTLKKYYYYNYYLIGNKWK